MRTQAPTHADARLWMVSAFVAVAFLLVPLGPGELASRADAASRCGSVKVKKTRYRVFGRGKVSCAKARFVIKFVLTHGKPTQGSPGRAPKGWSCGYGFGKKKGEIARAGPTCERRGGVGTLVKGLEPGFKPLRH